MTEWKSGGTRETSSCLKALNRKIKNFPFQLGPRDKAKKHFHVHVKIKLRVLSSVVDNCSKIANGERNATDETPD